MGLRSHSLIAIGAVLAVACVHRKAPRPEYPAWLISRSHPVALSSLRDGWKLYKSEGHESGLPPEAFQKLFAVRPRDGPYAAARLIAWPSDMRSMVPINTADKALEFVRLFTQHDTYWLFMFEYEGREPTWGRRTLRGGTRGRRARLG